MAANASLFFNSTGNFTGNFTGNDTLGNDTGVPEFIDTPWGLINFTEYVEFWAFDPDKPKPLWHRYLGMSLMNICYGLSVILIIAKVTQRLHKGRWRFGFLRMDDWWMLIAMIFIIFPLWVAGWNRYNHGFGLYRQNVGDEIINQGVGWNKGKAGYYFASAIMKVAVCLSFIHILPSSMAKLRIATWCLIGVAGIMGFTYSFMWVFYCRPIISNFSLETPPTWCFNDYAYRFTWIGLNFLVDICMAIIPFLLLKETFLKPHEKKGLMIVFAANLVGTVALTTSIYGALITIQGKSPWDDIFYHRMDYDCFNYVEILAYTFGACFPLFSAVLIRWLKTKSGAPQNTNSTWTWRKFVPGVKDVEQGGGGGGGGKASPGNSAATVDSKTKIVASAAPVGRDDSLDEKH